MATTCISDCLFHVDTATATDNRSHHHSPDCGHRTLAQPPADSTGRGDMNNTLSELANQPIIIETEICGVKMICDTIHMPSLVDSVIHHGGGHQYSDPPIDTSNNQAVAASSESGHSPSILPSCCGSVNSDMNTATTAAAASAATVATAGAAGSASTDHALSYTGSIICRICHNTDRVDRWVVVCTTFLSPVHYVRSAWTPAVDDDE